MMQNQLTSHRFAHARDERGFTLAELLVATVITLTAGGAALAAAIHFGRHTSGANGMTDLNQNLRVAMNLVVRDLLQAGMEIPVGGISIPSGPTVLQKVVRPGPIGSDMSFDEDWATIPAITPGQGIGPILNGTPTDMVTVLRGDARLPWDDLEDAGAVTIAADGSSITFPPGFPIDGDVDGVKEGDLLMVTANARTTLLEVTSVMGQTAYFATSAPSRLNQPNAPGSIMQLQSGGSFAGATARRILMVTYYIDTNGEAPALMRKQNYGDERKLAIGVDDLQLSWDLVDGMTNPSGVDEPEPPNTPHQIRKANLAMAARSFDRTANGAYLHASLKTQVALRSLAFVDRYK
jgi:hypothetical protein